MSESIKKKVSIIVPVFNTENYLRQCIESLVNQSYQNIEVILVNDGSTDNSGMLCDEYAARDIRIKVIHQENLGLSSSRNNGTRIAAGEYIMYLDSDDWIEQGTIEIVLNKAIDLNADIVFWGYIKEFSFKSIAIKLFETDIIFTNGQKQWLHRRLIGMVGEELVNPTKTDAYNSAWGKLYKRSIIIENSIEFFDTNRVGSEDVLFNIQAFRVADKILYLNHCFNHYRQNNPAAITKNHKSTLFPRFINLFSLIESYIIENKLSYEYYQALQSRIAMSIINCALSISSPQNSEDLNTKIKAIDLILSENIYQNALMQVNFTSLPLHWRLFFLTCKHKLGLLVYLQARIMLLLK